MTEEDIVERLRIEAQEICADTYPRWKNADETMDEAANEIERLRAELDSASLEKAWAERNAAVAELVNFREVSQAREAKLQDLTIWMTGACDFTEYEYFVANRYLFSAEQDDTTLKEAIKQARREALLEAAEWFGDTVKGREVKAELRRMAGEL
jgi:Cft2 family RNA processing exonuclease